jgi:hypothetical protein
MKEVDEDLGSVLHIEEVPELTARVAPRDLT